MTVESQFLPYLEFCSLGLDLSMVIHFIMSAIFVPKTSDALYLLLRMRHTITAFQSYRNDLLSSFIFSFISPGEGSAEYHWGDF